MDAQDIRRAASAVKTRGDGGNADKLMELARKWEEKKLYAAFCGHFSAGKSTLVNRLCGAPLLPTSPVPTSANIVSIIYGEPGAAIRRMGTGSNEAREEQIPLEDLAEYCKNGTEIETVEIRYPASILAGETVLLDTPGIDSTDAAHKLATESALHLADVVFYVMDYNHVQSEMNLAFTRKLNEWGKPLYLIVNQVDKHREQEISIAEYQAGVEKAFASWGVRPDGILYLSLKHPEHPLNEWNRLEWLFDQLKERKDELGHWSVERSCAELLKEHAKVIEAQDAEALQELEMVMNDGATVEEDEVGEYSRETDFSLLEADYQAKQLERSRLRDQPQAVFSAWKTELEKLIDNANLIPAETRDLAGRYLESRKPGFKTGWFSRASQTAKEREDRLAELYASFAGNVKAYLEWHIQDFLKKAEEEHGLGEALQKYPDPVSQEPDAEWLAAQVNENASFTNEYVMTYSKNISAAVKSDYRRRSLERLEQAKEILLQRSAELAIDLDRELETGSLKMEAYRKWKGIRNEEKEHLDQVADMLSMMNRERVPEMPNLKDAGKPGNPLRLAARTTKPEHSVGTEQRREAAGTGTGTSVQPTVDSASHGNKLREAADRLRQAAGLIAELPAMNSVRAAILDKADRLERSRFTVALFGAFSAGKSSFANAMIGERLLPVSPNPTTAAINRIMPPDEECPHGTVKVRMKSSEVMLEEVNHSLEVLDLPGGDWKPCLESIARLSPGINRGSGNPHFTFLKAVEKGWAEAEPLLGTEFVTPMDQFAGYAAEESKSCFVDILELHHNNGLTSQGIVLVDTPGADSVHSRHTGVAFNFIKNADAVLFVTYYNHAFSQADREFLLQLGRVRDTYEMDKMFFLVNASDLASSPEEREEVLKHVEANLIRHGIRNPRLFPVSSRLALEEKLETSTDSDNSGIRRFEEEFFRFTWEDLADLSVRSARAEVDRASDMLAGWIRRAAENEETRRRNLSELEENYRKLDEVFSILKHPMEEGELSKEIRELLFYVSQRAGFRFGEFFNEAFNPSALQDDGRNMQQAFRSAWYDFVRILSYSLSQEVLATTLRVDRFIHREAEKVYNRSTGRVADLLPDFQGEAYRPDSFPTPVIREELSAAKLDFRWLASFYKSGKAFFEEGGKEKLRSALEEKVKAMAAEYEEEEIRKLEEQYSRHDREWRQRLEDQLVRDAEQHYRGLKDALEIKADPRQLHSIYHRLVRIWEDQAGFAPF